MSPGAAEWPVAIGRADLERAAAWLRTPGDLAASGARVQMNRAGQGHVDLFAAFTRGLGFEKLDFTSGASKDASTPFVHLTLINDHQPRTERAHDRTVRWERSLGPDARGSFLGQPGRFIEDGVRKAQFCAWSEEGAKRTRDPALRFGVPCAITTRGGSSEPYSELLAEQAAVEGANNASLLWLLRSLRSRGVVAHGGGIHPIMPHAALLTNPRLAPSALARGGTLLLRFLDPSLLMRGSHLGTPVEARFEIRVFGLAQWEPLRVWTSRHGFSRVGSPWWNYTAAHGLTTHNRRRPRYPSWTDTPALSCSACAPEQASRVPRMNYNSRPMWDTLTT